MLFPDYFSFRSKVERGSISLRIALAYELGDNFALVNNGSVALREMKDEYNLLVIGNITTGE